MRIAQVESQREAAQREHEECLKRLSALRVQCEAHGSSLREKQHELHTEMIALEQASNEVASAQSRMAAQLEEAAGLNAQLAHAREETRALKQAHALLLQQQHLAARQMAPAKSELAQLEAEIKVLRQQVDEAVLHEKGGEEDGQSPAELQAQVDEARLRRQELQDELHVVNSLRRRQRAATEETRLGEARRELRRLQEENAKASAEVLALRSAPPLQAKPNLPISPAASAAYDVLETTMTIGEKASTGGGGTNPFRRSSPPNVQSESPPLDPTSKGVSLDDEFNGGFEPAHPPAKFGSDEPTATGFDDSGGFGDGGGGFGGDSSFGGGGFGDDGGFGGGGGFGDDAGGFGGDSGFDAGGFGEPAKTVEEPAALEASAAAVASERAAATKSDDAFGDSGGFGDAGGFGSGGFGDDAGFGGGGGFGDDAGFGGGDAGGGFGDDGGFGGGDDGGFGSADAGGFGGDDGGFGSADAGGFGDDAGFGGGGFGDDAGFGDDGGFGDDAGGFGDDAGFGGGGFGDDAGGFGDDGGFGGGGDGFGDDAGFGGDAGGFGGGDDGFGGEPAGFGDAFAAAPAFGSGSFDAAPQAADDAFGSGGFGDAGFGDAAAADFSAAAPTASFGDSAGFGDAGGFGDDGGFGDAGGFGDSSFETTTPAAPAPSGPPPAVQSLVEMGFSRSEAEKALSQCDGDLQRAATLLMDPPTAKPPPPPPPKPAPTPAFTEMVVELTAVQISDEFLPRLNGINGLAVAIDVLGVDEEPPTVTAAVDGSGLAKLTYKNSYSTTAEPFLGALVKALSSTDDEDSEIQFVVFSLDGQHPGGEPDEELGMASVSLRKLLKRDRDLELTPIKLNGVEGEDMGTLTCGVKAVQALKALAKAHGIKVPSGAGGGGAAPGAAVVPGGSLLASVAPSGVVAPSPSTMANAPAAASTFRFGPGSLGLILSDRDGGRGGVVVTKVDPGGQGAMLGVPSGSHIMRLNGEDVSMLTRAGFVEKVKASPRPMTLDVA